MLWKTGLTRKFIRFRTQLRNFAEKPQSMGDDTHRARRTQKRPAFAGLSMHCDSVRPGR